MIFLKLAGHYFEQSTVDKRIEELSHFESEAMLQTPLTYRLH